MNLIFIHTWIYLHINKLLMVNAVKVDGQDYHPPYVALRFCSLALRLAEVSWQGQLNSGIDAGDFEGPVDQVLGGTCITHLCLLSRDSKRVQCKASPVSGIGKSLCVRG